jgi:hypothetical protein
MGEPPPKDLQHLEDPPWLKQIIAQFGANSPLVTHGRRVAKDRAALLAKRSEATAPTRAQFVATALDHTKGDKKHLWRLWAIRDFEGPGGSQNSYSWNDNKCNLFVYEMLAMSGVQLPLISYDALGPDRLRPYLAREWADPKFEIPGFEVLQIPPDVQQPGDIAARAKDSENATGHVGIVAKSPDGSRLWTVSGRADGVVHNDWGFRDDNGGTMVFRRYVGTPK